MRKVFLGMAAVIALFLAAFPAAFPAAETDPAQEPIKVGVKREADGWYLENKVTHEKVTGLKGRNAVPEGSKDYYWFLNKKGKIARRAWITSEGNKYRAGLNGKLAAGRQKICARWYFFNRKTNIMLKNAWKKMNGEWYRFGENGRALMGLKTVGRFTYYFDPDNDGARTSGLKKINDKTYYFNERGRMQKGFVDINGKKYYLNASGVMVTGWLALNGKKYYFYDSGVMATGKVKIDGTTYDFGTKGYINEEESVLSASGEWKIRVNKSTNVVTIYRGGKAKKAMLCSPGLNDKTPSGTFSLGSSYAGTVWHELNGGVWGQYCRTITGNILFHSVYYYTRGNVHTLSTAEYDKLGSAASAGCVRLAAGDAYFIWRYAPAGTKVEIGYFGSDPLPRPSRVERNGKDYDPTDPDLND